MLPKLKRKPDAAGGPAVPAWHPNFRDYGRLPDVKVVRTAFFVNGIAVLVMTALLLWLAFQEYRLHALRVQLASVEQQITRDRPASMRAVALYKKFQAGEARLREIDAFMKSKPALSAFVLRLGETLPPQFALDAVTWREGNLNLRAAVRGTPDTASGRASAYVDKLRADPVLGSAFETVSLTSLVPSPTSPRLLIEIVLQPKAPAPVKGKK